MIRDSLDQYNMLNGILWYPQDADELVESVIIDSSDATILELKQQIDLFDVNERIHFFLSVYTSE